jgi:hypothetical protein
MALQDIYFVAEIVGVIAVVTSLVVVARQLYQNTAAVQASNSQAATQFWTDAGLAIANDGELANILVEDQYPELTAIGGPDANAVRAGYFVTVSLRHVENNYLQWRNGTLSDEVWHGNRSGIVQGFAVQRTYAALWERSRDGYSEPFRELIDTVVIEAEEMRRKFVLSANTDGAPNTTQPILS